MQKPKHAAKLKYILQDLISKRNDGLGNDSYETETLFKTLSHCIENHPSENVQDAISLIKSSLEPEADMFTKTFAHNVTLILTQLYTDDKLELFDILYPGLKQKINELKNSHV